MMIYKKIFSCAVLSLTMFWDFPASAGTSIESVTTLIIKEPVVAPLIIDWLVPILHVGNLQNLYLYFCSGVLIHSRVVLSAGKAFDEKYPFLYSVGNYEWKYGSAKINTDKLKNVIRVKKDSESNDVTFELDPSRIHINRTVLLVLNEPIKTVNPINIEDTLPLSYIYNRDIPKRCYHIRMIEDAETFGFISNSTTFLRKFSLEIIITNSTYLNKLYNFTKMINFSGVIDGEKNNVISDDSQVFFTKNKFTYHRDPFLGAPILCQNPRTNGNYSLAGIITDTMDRLFQYTIVNNSYWIKENLDQILTTL